MSRQVGKAVLLTVLAESASTLKMEYNNAFADIPSAMPSRVQSNIAVLAVGAYILDQVAKRHGAKFSDLFGMERSEALALIIDAVKRYTLDGGHHNRSVVDKAFETFDRMAMDILKHEFITRRSPWQAAKLS